MAGQRPALDQGTREAIVRWAVSGVFLIACLGLVSTLGVTVSPVLAWVVAVIISGIVMARVWYVAEERRIQDRDRSAAQSAGGRFDARGADEDDEDPDDRWASRGGTSMTVGPGRDDAPHPSPWGPRSAGPGAWSDPDDGD